MVNYSQWEVQQTYYVKFILFKKIKFIINLFLDIASGASPDWAYGVKKIVHSYVVELRPRNGAGVASFDLNIAQIPLVGNEIYAGVKALIKFI